MDKIVINGYKSIKSLDLQLRPINVLIGANGAGKTNFISFFRFLKTAYDQQLQLYVAKNGGVNKFLHNGKKQTEQIECSLYFPNTYYKFILDSGTDSFIVKNEILGDDISETKINASPTFELKLKSYGGLKRVDSLWFYLNGLKVYHFHETGEKSPFNTDSKINDNHTLSSHGDNLASVLYCLQQSDPVVYNRIVKTIRSIAPYFLDFDLQPNVGGSEYIRLGWRDKYSETLYGPTDLSDGTIRFIALATLFLQPNPPQVIIIDEPELGLHPFAISKLAGLVKSVAGRGIQVILSTQSVELVNCFEPEDVIAVDNVAGESKFERLDSSKLSAWLEEYAVGDMWRQNILSIGFPNK